MVVMRSELWKDFEGGACCQFQVVQTLICRKWGKS